MGNDMRANTPALYANELGAKMERVALGEGMEKVFACRRAVEGSEVYAFFNFSDEVVELPTDVLPADAEILNRVYLRVADDKLPASITLDAWGCAVIIY
jgi:hypothetical protein